MEQQVKATIEKIAKELNTDLSVASSIYLFRLTGIKPICETRQGKFKLTYHQNIKLALAYYMDSEGVMDIYQQMVDDWVWVWEHPLLDLSIR